MKKLIIIGTGKLAELVKFYFTHDANYEVIAFSEDADLLKEDTFSNLPVIPLQELVIKYPPAKYDVFVAIGYKKHNRIRAMRFQQIKKMGYKCPTYISKSASYYGTQIGENCLILENNVIQPYVNIGSSVFLWSGNHIGHHSSIEDNCFVSSHVVVAGNCIVQNNCFLGVNSTLRDGIIIGAESVIGAGATVMNHCSTRTLIMPQKSITRTLERDIL